MRLLGKRTVAEDSNVPRPAALTPSMTEPRATSTMCRGPGHASALLVHCLADVHRATSEAGLQVTNWRPLIRAACAEWLGGLMLQGVERHRWPVFQTEKALLRRQALQIRDNNLRMMRRLIDVTVALRERDVDVLLLKGAGLNLTLYERLDLRPMSDLDVLVRPEAAGRAVAALEDLGCRRGPDLVRNDFFPRFHYEVEYCTGDRLPVRIDLHVRPFRPLRYAHTVPPDAYWEQSRVLDVGGACVRVPANEDQLIHLATHAACHGESRLLWLYDILRLIDTCGGQLDWDRFLYCCRRWRLVLPVRQTLRRAGSLWGPGCWNHVGNVLEGDTVGWKDRLCLAQAPRDANHPVAHVAVNLLCTRGLRFRAGYLLAVLLPGRGHMAQVYGRRHPGWLACAHVWRWLRAVARVMTLRGFLRAFVHPAPRSVDATTGQARLCTQSAVKRS
jgi:hypothetical protein